MADQEAVALAPANTTKASEDSLVAQLEQELETKRKALGIDLDARPKKIPLRELNPIDPRMAADWEQRERERKFSEEKTRRAEAWHRLVEACGIRYEPCTLDSFEATIPRQAKALASVREYANDLPRRVQASEGLLLYGPVGTGKDHLAVSVCRRAILQHGFSVDRINGLDWFGEIRDAMDGDDATKESRLIARLARPDFLIVSDPVPPFGNLGQHMASMFCRVVERRSANKKPIIVTINVKDDSEGRERLGVPTWDRLRDACWMISCNWPSHRKPAREIK